MFVAGSEHLDSFLPIRRDENAVTVTFESRAGQFLDDGFVIDNQDGGGPAQIRCRRGQLGDDLGVGDREKYLERSSLPRITVNLDRAAMAAYNAEHGGQA